MARPHGPRLALIVIEGAGNVSVVDVNNHRIQTFGRPVYLPFVVRK